MTTLRCRAPAKLNLGLEVIGRRPDGYHELVTIFQTIGLYDDLALTATTDGAVRLTADPGLGGEQNLVLRAARALASCAGRQAGASLTLEKRIPVAAGLGGGSSDAALTLRALRDLWGLAIPDDTLHAIATGLGADVPFFLRGGAALATGTGDILSPLPSLRAWFVLLTPDLSLPPDKTAYLYAALTTADFSNGARTLAQADRLRRGESLDSALLVNAFTEPQLRHFPAIAHWRDRFLAAGAAWVQVSGSGPTLFTAVNSRQEGEALARALPEDGATIAIVPAVSEPAPHDRPGSPERA